VLHQLWRSNGSGAGLRRSATALAKNIGSEHGASRRIWRAAASASGVARVIRRGGGGGNAGVGGMTAWRMALSVVISAIAAWHVSENSVAMAVALAAFIGVSKQAATHVGA